MRAVRLRGPHGQRHALVMLIAASVAAASCNGVLGIQEKHYAAAAAGSDGTRDGHDAAVKMKPDTGVIAKPDAGPADADTDAAKAPPIACTGNARKCSGDVPQHCVLGAWAAQAACPKAPPRCSPSSGECVACLEGAAECVDATTPHNCSGGAWVAQATCPGKTVCSGGKCTDTVLTGGIVTTVGTTTGNVRLRSGGLEVQPRSCTATGDIVCVTGGIVP
jgi:hypothetical protein